MVLISACLAGKPCRYDGKSKPDEKILQLIQQGQPYVLVCPECLGALHIPRPPAEICGGTGMDVLAGRACVYAKDGTNVTEAFVLGAQRTLALAREVGAHTAYLKSRSPSCGAGCICDGSFTGATRKGNGVAAELLIQNGIQVISV